MRILVLTVLVTCYNSTAVCYQRRTRHLDAQSKLRISLNIDFPSGGEVVIFWTP